MESLAKNKKGRKQLTENQDIFAITLFLGGGQNSTPEIAKRLGVDWWLVDSAIDKYLRGRKAPEYQVFESKINKE